jgi:hypothetical protein
VEQALDLVMFVWHRRALRGYRDWLVPHLRNGQHPTKQLDREYLNLRSAHATLLFIMAEATVLFSWAPQQHSLLQRHPRLAIAVALLAAIAALFQWWILDRLDCDIVGTSPTRQTGEKSK